MPVQVRSPHLFSHSCVPVYFGIWTALGNMLSSFPALLSAFPDREPDLHPAPMVYEFYTDLMLFGGLVCIPSSVILLDFLIYTECWDHTSRYFFV